MSAITVTEASVRRAADPMSFQRGLSYARAGQVRNLRVKGPSVRAIVEGTHPYRVTVTVTASGLLGECTCPYGEDGTFCKHCVATTLVWLDSGQAVSGARQPDPTDDALRAFLSGQEPKWLADQLLEVAHRDPLLRAQLQVAAGGEARTAYDDGELRAALVEAIGIHDFVDYRGAYSYATDVGTALDRVRSLIAEGFPDAAIELAEFALELLEESVELIDDSDGWVGGAMRRAEAIHLEACQAGDPDRVALAERLADRGLTSDWEIFLTALPDYADVLGADGMARYREIVEVAWRALPPTQLDSERFQPTYLMERLAECEGGTDALIEVMARDVATSYDVVRIAEVLVEAGRDDEALDWATRGLAEYGANSGLRQLAAGCHLRAGRRDDAVELLWADFATSPALDSYQRLHDAAEDAMSAWRTRALALLGNQPRSPDLPPGRYPYAEPAGHSTLVEVLLWEGDTDAAWAAAQKGGCRRTLWLRLARERGKTHPADGVPILQRAAEIAIEGKQRKAYQEAARLLREVQTFARRSGEVAEFDAYILRLRAAHKPKRALREELDRAGLPNH